MLKIELLPQLFIFGKSSNHSLKVIRFYLISRGNDLFGQNVPYLFYFQSLQGDPFKEVREKNLFGISEELIGVKFCEEWDGIPA